VISIIMPSYLGAYKHAAKDRDKKIVRAIYSVCRQTYKDWELVVIADGCNKTVDIVQEIVDIYTEFQVNIIYINKQPTWSGIVRNTGLDAAKGDYCCYLDIDDAFAPGHLEGLEKGSRGGKDWYWFDDYVWNGQEFRHRRGNINKAGQCGTSNVMHRRDIARWGTKGTYAHDWIFIRNLKRGSKDFEYVKAGRYLVCHVPAKFDI